MTCADLSLFQVAEDLCYAFPAATSHVLANLPRVTALRLTVAQRPRVSLLDSDRRVPFNEIDIFRRYLDLDE